MTPLHPTGHPSFALRLGLGQIPASVEDIMTELGDRLETYQPDLRSRPDGSVVLSLTIVAADLWLAILLAMAGVTGTGYSPTWIEAEPAG